MRLVLASASPRRLALLRAAGADPDVVPADVDEAARADEPPGLLVRRLARDKAAAAAALVGDDAVVLGGDTLVVVEGEVLAKPRDEADAARMLRRLSGALVEVVSGVAVQHRGAAADGAGTTRLRMHELGPVTIADYVATGEPFGAAGAFRIQGRGGELVASREGRTDTVVGLPRDVAATLLRAHGVEIDPADGSVPG